MCEVHGGVYWQCGKKIFIAQKIFLPHYHCTPPLTHRMRLGLLRGRAVSGHDSQGLSSCTCLGDNFLAEFGQGGGQGHVAVLSGVDRLQVPQLHGIVHVHIRAGQAESRAGIEEMDFHEFA